MDGMGIVVFKASVNEPDEKEISPHKQASTLRTMHREHNPAWHTTRPPKDMPVSNGARMSVSWRRKE